MYCLNMLAIALELARDDSGLRGRREQVLRALPVHRRGAQQHRRHGHPALGRGGRVLLRRAAHADRRCPEAESPLAGRTDAAAGGRDDRRPTCWSTCPTSSDAWTGSSTIGQTWPAWSRAGSEPGMGERRLLALVRGHRMKRLLKRMLDPEEFLSDYGIRALSRYHLEHPYRLDLDGASIRSPLRAGRIEHRPVRRQLQLARPDLVSDQLPAHRGAPEVPPLLRRRLSRRMPDRLGQKLHAVAGRRGHLAPPGAHLPARRGWPPPRVRRRRVVSARSALARPRAVPRVLPRRQRPRRRRQPPDGLDGPRRQAPGADHATRAAELRRHGTRDLALAGGLRQINPRRRPACPVAQLRSTP